MKKQITAWGIIFLLSCSWVQAQEIQLYFPHFAGHQYDWKIFQGEKELSVISGEIPKDGRVPLVMPEAHKDYRGMTRWMLKNGGGLDMIYTDNVDLQAQRDLILLQTADKCREQGNRHPDILSDMIMGFSLAQKTPMEAMMFVKDLQEKIREGI
jgi:hypothetical protein